VAGYLEAGKQEGAKAITGCKIRPGSGYFIEPTVFVDTKADHEDRQEEIFGPVVTAAPFQGLDDAVRKGNDTIYGRQQGYGRRTFRKRIALPPG